MRRTHPALVLALTITSACTVPSSRADDPTAGSDTPGAIASAPAPAHDAPRPAPVPDPAPRLVTMRAHGGLGPEVAAAAVAIDGVVAAVHLRSDTIGLTGSRLADGTPVDLLTAGWQIPIDVLAVDPGTMAATLPPGTARATLAALRPGEVLLPASSAERRRVGVGDRLDLGGRTDLVVAAVVEDGALGNDEVVAHLSDADAIGLEPDGSLRILHDGTTTATLADDLVGLAPPDVTVRVVGDLPGASPRRTRFILPLPQVKDRFGEFAYRVRDGVREVDIDPAWVDANIVVAEVPILGAVRCHRAIVDDLTTALQAVVDHGLAGTIDPAAYAGCFHARRIGTDTSSLSRHSWGIALDINVDLSLPGLGPPPGPVVVEAFAAAGFSWGGRFLAPDNHHFEWIGDGT